MLDPRVADEIPGDMDPALRSEIAHETAGALVARARAAAPDDPALQERLLRLVETEGVDMVATMWAHAPADSLPGALYRLYLLREWVRQDPTLPDRYALGAAHAEVNDVIAGVAKPPGVTELRELADAVLSGVFTGELDVALNRAAAFCRVLSVGSAVDADTLEAVDANRARRNTFGAASLLGTAADLDKAAAKWKAGTLD
jgi:hypothetical protein